MDNKKPPQSNKRNYDVIDPLGEIRRHAKQLWKDAGSPEDKDWSDFFDDAESLLVKGRSSGTVSGRNREKKIEQPEISPYIQSLINQRENILLSMLAESFGRELDMHDTVCLAAILSANELILKDGTVVGPLSEQEIGKLLAPLAKEYDRFFLEQFKTEDSHAVPLEKRVEYWLERVVQIRAADKPLSYNDRNTIIRLEQELHQHGITTRISQG